MEKARLIMKAKLKQGERLRILLTESLILAVPEAKLLLEGFKLYEPIKTPPPKLDKLGFSPLQKKKKKKARRT